MYIELKSIGHFYDPVKKVLYPINADNTADKDNEVLVSEVEKGNGISDKDWNLIHEEHRR